MSVTHPKYYGKIYKDYELIDYMLAKDPEFSRLIALKYLLRAGRKGTPYEDLKKAKYYLEYIPKKDAVKVLEENCKSLTLTKQQLLDTVNKLLDDIE